MRHCVKQGFTLIELAIMLSIVAILVTASLPSIIWFNQQILYAEAQKLTMTAAHLQHKALLTNQEIVLKIDVTNNGYTNNTLSLNEKLQPAVCFGIKQNVYGPPSRPIALIKQPCTFSNNQIIFYPNGTITAGTLYLLAPSMHLLYALSIGVAQVPFIRIYRHAAQGWHLVT